ncbi:hypothetical protein JR316_0011436 [Psilocybe cubensis]|uniref:Uncharacterized protein n=1 Tax=Psilocybe cubensis TaxID=181762 RepID=A0ACB8GK20_PSICU|nr:hypothetical protein JR316_0011436 [Psilocybe cubensis]KAH9475876.1 hypothetical protein JR316_0011436 [Psilocybe cubensis]
MFSISTADMVISVYYLFRYTLNNLVIPSRYPTILFFITNNAFADAILIYRFYTIWCREKRYILPPSVILLCSSIFGYLFSNSPSDRLYKLVPVSMWMTFGLNACLTLLIAGRLFWSGRNSSPILGPDLSRRYFCLCALIIDSGSIYSTYLLLDLITHWTLLRAGLNQIVGMVPTLIIIRISLRRASLNGSTILPRAGGSSTPVLDSIFSTVGTGAPNTAPQSPRGGGGEQLPHELTETA